MFLFIRHTQTAIPVSVLIVNNIRIQLLRDLNDDRMQQVALILGHNIRQLATALFNFLDIGLHIVNRPFVRISFFYFIQNVQV